MAQPLVEGVDYYMEGDKLVFTADYHRKRGYCCNSRCRHCPYKGTSEDTARILLGPVPPETPKR
ncbi:MAG TPA: DUF5522 domain-containing protein [Polyangiaceae bacterium]|jgi:hypothetical protein|nr:DUF5522 domain-containing protein [Polyangiaceae bacterium]